MVFVHIDGKITIYKHQNPIKFQIQKFNVRNEAICVFMITSLYELVFWSLDIIYF